MTSELLHEILLEQVSPENNPISALEHREARLAFIDTIGVLLAGTRTKTTARLAGHDTESRGQQGQRLQRLVGDPPGETELPDWLVAAGTAAHALDYDDVLETMNGHPSAILIPAAWGVGRSLNVATEEVINSYVLGVRACSVLAGQIDVKSSYAQGWHATSVIGVLGATVSVAHLLKLNKEQLAQALGIAASTASGLRENFGTDTKPLHAGLAARAGYEAARWAQNGVSSSLTALDGPAGWAELLGARYTGNRATYGSAIRPLEAPGLDKKPFPCCYNIQRMATVATAMYSSIANDEIISVRVRVEHGALRPLKYKPPRSGLEAKFSAEYVIAEALNTGSLPLESFEDDYVQTAESRQLIPRIVIQEQALKDNSYYEYPNGYAEIQVTLNSGTELTNTVYAPHGHHSKPMTEQDIVRKFNNCCAFANASVAEADDILMEFAPKGPAPRNDSGEG